MGPVRKYSRATWCRHPSRSSPGVKSYRFIRRLPEFRPTSVVFRQQVDNNRTLPPICLILLCCHRLASRYSTQRDGNWGVLTSLSHASICLKRSDRNQEIVAT